MKAICTLLVALTLSFVSQAAPGDTTWVKSHDGTWMPHVGNYDTAVAFPNGTKSYRKVIMIFTLGKYVCPGSPQFCADWDYTVQNFLMTPTDTFELGRLITPYGSGKDMGPDWKFRYVYDVTDFYPMLKDNAIMRINYSGFSYGYTGGIEFAFIEGTPERPVVGVERIYKGSANYGQPTSIENKFPAVSLTPPAGTVDAELKFTITGHGSDPAGCSEFCSKWYDVLMNGNSLGQTDIWRDDCGKNVIPAQNGTWVYDRGNWCPGNAVQVNSHPLTGATAGTPMSVNIDFQPYTSANAQPSYITEGVVVYYGAKSHTVDASLVAVKRPSDHEMYANENPMCGKPVIHIRNSGSTAITSLKLEHGANGSPLSTFAWTGNISSFQEADIELPELYDLRKDAGGTSIYTVKIAEVNGASDGDASNNTINSTYKPVDKWGVRNRIEFKTNNRAGENKWVIRDLAGNIVVERNGLAANTVYIDTVTLGPSCYTFEMTDNNCDGLSWWANAAAGSGYLKIYNLDQISIIKPFNLKDGDFGCGFSQTFTSNWKLGVATTQATTNASLDAYPNPAADVLNINITGLKKVNGTLTLIDATGRVVLQQTLKNSSTSISVGQFAKGMYQLRYMDAANGVLQQKIVLGN